MNPALAPAPSMAGAAPSAMADASMRALALQATVLSHTKLDASASAFATGLARGFGCSRVTIGFLTRGTVALCAVSHGSGGNLDGAAFDPISLAMDEAVQQSTSICLPADAGARSVIGIAHARLLQGRGGSVASVPMIHAGEIVGAVCCEWSKACADFHVAVSQIETAISLAGPVLDLMRERETPWHARAGRALGEAWKRALDPSDRRFRWAIGATAATLVLLCAVPFDYRVGGRARIEGQGQRALVAPSDGFLRLSHVRPGDPVTKGQLLVEMADQDLVLQRRKWASELGQQESAHAVALARSDRSALVIALAHAEQARTQLDMIDADLARLRVVAPFDGVVIEGDLQQAAGSPIERGKPLLTIAPAGQFRVVVDIDERDVAGVHAGQAGALSLAALPWDSLPLTVTRVTPIARTVDGNNVFEVESEVATGAERIRPGLEGVAKIVTGREPLAWAWSHRAFEWARLKAWGWWA